MAKHFISIISLAVLASTLVSCKQAATPNTSQMAMMRQFSQQQMARTPLPLPTATSDTSVVERTVFNGFVKAQNGQLIDGVVVKAVSLNAAVPYQASTTTVGGSYAFNNAPAGVQLEIFAAHPNHGEARRLEVLRSNNQGNPNVNRYDFVLSGLK